MRRVILSVLVLFCLTISYSFSAQTSNPGDFSLLKFKLIKDNVNRTDFDRTVKVEDGQLLVDFDGDGVYKKFLIKGVGYSPVPIGRSLSDWEPNIFDDSDILGRDFPLLEKMRANTIRIWKGNDTQDGSRFQTKLTQNTLDMAEDFGLKIIAGFYMPPGPDVAWGIDYSQCNGNLSEECKDLLDDFMAYVGEFKGHSAILFWAIGNENNRDFEDLADRQEQRVGFYYLVNKMAAEGKKIEGLDYRPVAVVNGGIEDIGIGETSDTNLGNIDIWGANVYRGRGFNNVFGEFTGKSNKAFWISEYGIDAVNGLEEDQITQDQWAGDLWDEIFDASVTAQAIGGTIMAYSDEWWKPWSTDDGCQGDGCGDDLHQLDGYSCPAQPDGFCHEEWWGIVSIAPGQNPTDPNEVTPRQVYYTLKSKWLIRHPDPFQAPAKYE